MDDTSNYEKLRNDSQKYYSSIGHIKSPALEEFISFKSEGFNHILYKNSNNKREQKSQMLRFKLLPLAKKLIEISTTYQEFEETIQEFMFKERKSKRRLKKHHPRVVFFIMLVFSLYEPNRADAPQAQFYSSRFLKKENFTTP